MVDWTPTRSEGLRRLETFLPAAGYAYAKQRNIDLGPGRHRHVSILSPWIRHRLVLEEEVVSAVLSRHSRHAAEKFVQEVLWRTYWKGWLELRPAIWAQYRDDRDRLIDELQSDHGLHDRWRRAVSGQTGIDCFDAWTRELVETGYLHNHARMWFASIWIFTLALPWELGADLFLRHLLDGDPAANTLSWRWVAGLQTRGKTYLARPGNIARYTEGRFNPEGQLAPTAPPLAGRPAPPTGVPPAPPPWDRAVRTGLLLTEEDLHPQSLFSSEDRLLCVAGVRVTERRSPLAISPAVSDFSHGAVTGALDELTREGHRVAGYFAGADAADAIVNWARSEELSQIATAYVPVGPTRDFLEGISRRLQPHGIRLVQELRRWDATAWPFATKTFFPFREKIEARLDDLLAEVSPAA